jgi:predicted permease
MYWFRLFASRFAGVFRPRAERAFEQEIEEHLELLTARFERQGITAEKAREAARQQFGNLGQVKEQHYEGRGIPALEDAFRDVHFGLRQLRRQPSFSLIAIVVLALGIGANTAIFSVVNGVLLRPLPFEDPERLVALFETNVIDNNDSYNTVAPANFLDWQKQSTTLEQIAAVSFTSFNLKAGTNDINAERVDGCGVSANFFKTLGIAPTIGRTFSSEEDRPGGAPVAVISYGLWKRRFGGSSNVLSQQIRLGGKPFSIIGVAPASFRYPSRSVQVWIPLQQHLSPVVIAAHDNHVLSSTIGRLKPGVTVEQARTEIDAIVKRYKRQHPAEVMGKGGNVVPLGAFTLKDIRTSLLLLFGAVACVLLIACVNVANLLLTRALGRKREIAIRAGIGASRGRIIRQLLIESSLLSLLGATVGLLIAYSLVGYLAANIPGAAWLPQSTQVHVDVRVFFFSVGLAIVTGLSAGFFPAYQISRVDLANDLRDASRTNTPGQQQNRFRDVLVATEVALCLVLLVAAGLLMRSFEQLLLKNLGLRVNNTLVMRLSLPDSRYHERTQIVSFLRALQDRLKDVPGVTSVGLSSCPLVSGPGYCPDTVFQIEGHSSPAGHLTDAEYREVSPGFFRAAGMPVLNGRMFTERDGIGLDDTHPHSGQVIVNSAFARRFFPSETAIGKHIQLFWFVGNNTKESLLNYEIVGQVGNALARPDAPAGPIFYLPIFDGDSTDISIVLDTANEQTRVAAEAQGIIRQLDSDLAIFGVQSVSQPVEDTIQGRRYMTLLFGTFAALALVLATVGLYGVVSRGVLQRRNEIAVRMAIGATTKDVLTMVLSRGLRPTVAGVAIGIPVAILAARFLSSQLFQVGPSDPLTFALVSFILLVVALLACFLPAIRAVRIDPMIGLRLE